MSGTTPDRDIIRNAWVGRVSGCVLGKPIEYMCQQDGNDALRRYLEAADALPLRDYIPLIQTDPARHISIGSTRDNIDRAGPDDDINYTVLALVMLERYGLNLSTGDVGHTWLTMLPAGSLWTAEREAYRVLLELAGSDYQKLVQLGSTDLSACSRNPYNEWIGAQIRTDLYGWVNPGRPDRADALARADAALSHAGTALEAAAFVAVLGATIPTSSSIESAIHDSLPFIDGSSNAAAAVRVAIQAADDPDGLSVLRRRYHDSPFVGSSNNLALVVWALLRGHDDFSVAIGDAVAAGWDTDCNGATVGGLWGLSGAEIPRHWAEPWSGRVAVELAGMSELTLDELAERTFAVATSFSQR